jgi:glycolate oxidase iron-sulfur subunit
VLTGDERDSPRGRIWLIKDMLENQRQPGPEVVRHVDRCLSCLSCMTTCPSGVNYMHLVDHARAYIAAHHRRPWPERALRRVLALVLPHPARFALALRLGRLVRPLRGPLARVPALRPLAAMLDLIPAPVAAPVAPPVNVTAARGRVIVLRGCAEPVLQPAIRAATLRVLARAGYAVVTPPGEGCCGALVHHMGQKDAALAAARRNIDAWSAAEAAGPIAAIVITTSGCGTSIKDYGHLLRDDPAYAARAAHFSALARDVSEFCETLDPLPATAQPLRVAYHAACSLQHGQKVTDTPKRLLQAAGYQVVTPAEAHLCCGSAGTYNILQPELADRIGRRKVANLDRLQADVIAAGNVGCAMQIGQRTATPVVHTIELIDWAQGGPCPPGLRQRAGEQDAMP